MHIQEIWRYPVKSMGGERVAQIQMDSGGLAGDRKVVVQGPTGRVLTSRMRPGLLGLKGTIDGNGQVRISGHLWNSAEALALVRETAGMNAKLVYTESLERFDILPLLVATDGAIEYMHFDGRRLRPNIVVGGVPGLKERSWPGRDLQLGDTVIHAAQLRARCVMTTYDPDTQEQDLNVLRSIVRELDGVMALDCAVLKGGTIREGDAVKLLSESES
ncbi:MAG: domain containing protein [Candidatus Solibacter sp.]|nr:domain containing protein [Candidatus Solibacter sp.]